MRQNRIKKLTKFVETANTQGLQTLANFAKNPQGMMQGQLLGLLGRASIVGLFVNGKIT